MGFQGLKGGDRIQFWIPSGLRRLPTGQVAQDFVKRTAKVQPLLVFPTHVVVNLGGKHGKPYTVDESNFIGRTK
jgi:hypothetical protein